MRQGEKEKILIVDDDADFVEAVKLELEGAGFECITSTVPAEAINLARSRKPSVVIMDVVMPMVSGLSLCKTLKKGSMTGNIPVILTSGRKTDESAQKRGKQTGADAYMLKPLEMRQLVRKVRVLLQNAEKQ